MIEVDVLTIGAGGGAYPGAFRLAKAGFSVLMVDKKGVMSGNCLAEGCVPSKAIREQIHTYIKIFTSVEVQEIGLKDNKKVVYYKQDDTVKSIEVDEVLMAVGRKPVIPEGADKFLKISKAIEVNRACHTNIPHIYASGDVNGQVPLFHTALRQSLVCAYNIMANNTPIDYADFENVPFTVFTIPAMAFVGITKEKAESLNMDIVETSFDLKEDSRAEIYSEEGELKLFFDAKSLKLVGAYIVGTDAEQLVSHLGLAIKLGASARDLAEHQDQHPMTQECISKAARKLF